MKSSVSIVVTAVIVAAQAAVGVAEDRERVQLPWKGYAQSEGVVVFPDDPLHPDRCGVLPAAILAGTGLTTLLGPFEVRQSHCLGQNGAFDQGEFTFTTAAGRSIRGMYSGQVVPTFPPAPGVSPEIGVIQGSVCVEGGNALPGIVNDCAAGRYSPALGVLNLLTLEGTIFIDYALGLTR